MDKLSVYKPPILAVIEQNTKLRDYNEVDRLGLCKKIITTLLNDLGVGSKADTNHHVRAIKFLLDNYIHYSVEEIEKAFSLAISGKLNIDLFQQINPLIVGKVMKAYEDYKKEKLKVYRQDQLKSKLQIEMTNEEKLHLVNSAVKKQYEYFLEKRLIDKSRIHVYTILDEKGFMRTDKEYKKEVKKDAIHILKKEYENKKAGSREEKKQINNTIANIIKGSDSEIITKCKELALEEFFRVIEKDEVKMKEFKGEYYL